MTLSMESHHWDHARRHGPLFPAPIDTTFALYRPGALFEVDGFRTAPLLVRRHLPW